MSIVNYASPEYRFYDTDKKIMEDYDNRIGIYNTALGEYNTQAGDYQKLVDDFNTNQIEPWNANLAQWQQDRETYNAAIEKWNATDRTTPYESWSGTVTSPGNFESTAPVFEGGAAPVAPDDPGFAGSDVDAFIEESQARAQRRGAANATAQAVIGNTSGAFGSGAGEQLVRDGAGSAGFQAGDINLAGNAGLSSTAMGFEDGGMVQNYAQGGAINSPYSASLQQANQGNQQMLSMGGIGDLFQNQFGSQMQNQFGSQMADLQGSPLKNYQNYLMGTYGQKAMENVSNSIDDDVGHFVGMVDEAERAHFGAEESFGFGGGQMHLDSMKRFEPSQGNSMTRAIGEDGGGGFGGMEATTFAMGEEDGGGGASRGSLETLQPMDFGTESPFGDNGMRSQATNLAQAYGGEMTQLFADGGVVEAPATPEQLTSVRQKIMEDYGFDPVELALQENVDPELALRVAYQENKGRQGPVSEKGAIGLMQLMPGTAKELGVDPNDPKQNFIGGLRYLNQQLKEFGTVPLALAAYNAGPGKVRKYGGVPPFAETRKYVSLIHGAAEGEILPAMNGFFQMAEGEDPTPKPRGRPEGIGQPGYTPTPQEVSEYLMMNQEPEVAQAPAAPPMRPQARPEPPQDTGIGQMFKEYAAYDYEQKLPSPFASGGEVSGPPPLRGPNPQGNFRL